MGEQANKCNMKTLQMKKFTIYALVESFDIKYVGITSIPIIKRLYQHFYESIRNDSLKSKWIKECAKGGREIKIKPLRTANGFAEASKIERQIIKKLACQLVNVSGKVQTQETHDLPFTPYNGPDIERFGYDEIIKEITIEDFEKKTTTVVTLYRSFRRKDMFNVYWNGVPWRPCIGYSHIMAAIRRAR